LTREILVRYREPLFYGGTDDPATEAVPHFCAGRAHALTVEPVGGRRYAEARHLGVLYAAGSGDTAGEAWRSCAGCWTSWQVGRRRERPVWRSPGPLRARRSCYNPPAVRPGNAVRRGRE
jgi:hypothetical protein